MKKDLTDKKLEQALVKFNESEVGRKVNEVKRIYSRTEFEIPSIYKDENISFSSNSDSKNFIFK